MQEQKLAGGELKRTLGLPSLVFYGVGSMLGAGIYGLVGEATALVGSAVWLAFLLAAGGAMLTGLTYAALVSKYPRAGGASYITGMAFRSPGVAFVVGIAVMASGLTSMASASNVFGRNFASVLGWNTGGGTTAWVAAGMIVLLGAVNWWGLRESAAVNTVCTVVEAGGLLMVVGLGMRFWGDRNLLEFPAEHGSLLSAGVVIAQGAVLTFFSFIGFEDLLNVSEEAKDAERAVPLALVVAQVVVVLVYLGVAVTAVSVLPWQELAVSRTPLADVARRASTAFPGWVIPAITCFAVLNTSLLNYVMGSRLIYGMSRDGLLPEWLGRVGSWRRTPGVAIAVLGVMALGLRMMPLSQTAAATVLLLLGVFVMMNVSLLLLRRRGEAAGPFRVPVWVPVLGAAICLGLIVARTLTTGAGPSLWIAGGIVAGATVLYGAGRKGSTAS